MLKYLIPLTQVTPVQAKFNLLAGIRPFRTNASPKFLDSNSPDPGCFDSGGKEDSYSPLQMWAFDLKSSEDINTVSIFFNDKLRRPQQIDVRVGLSSDFSRNPLCAVSDRLPDIDPERAWLRCGFKGNFVSVSFCGDAEELEISAYSQHRINLRKIFTTKAQLGEDHVSITWVNYSALPSSQENVVEGSILEFNSAISISYFKMADFSKSFAFFLTDAQKTEYPCEPVPSEGSFYQVICNQLRGGGIIFDLARQNLPDSIFVLSSSNPATIKLDSNFNEQIYKNQQRQLAACTGAGCYCTNPTGMLNLLNTSVLAQQSSFQPCCSQNPGTACDGFAHAITKTTNPFTFAWDETKLTAPGLNQFWQATFTATTSIKSQLIITRDDCVVCKSRPPEWKSTFGTNSDIYSNPVFMHVGAITDGGWYVRQDSMTGTIFGIYSTTDQIDPVEIMLYSQEAIQINALVFVTGPNGQYPAVNALKKLVVLLVTTTTNTCVDANIPTTGPAKVEINLKAFGYINGAALLAGYTTDNTQWHAVQTNVAVSVNIVGNIKYRCGVLTDYYSKYSEVTCNVFSNQIIFEQLTTGSDLRFCGVAVLSDCDCSITSFDPASFTIPPTASLVSANFISKFVGDTVDKTVIVSSTIPDTVSTLCGNGDGTAKCGQRSIKFYDRANVEISSWPYLGITWDQAARTISLQGVYQTPGTFTIDVEISLTIKPQASYRKTITVTVSNYCSSPTDKLNLLNTSVLAQQSSYHPDHSKTAVTACDGVVHAITSTLTPAFDLTKITVPALGPSQFWMATFQATTSIKSSLIIHRDDCTPCKSRPRTWTSTLGANQVITLNPVFMPVGAMTDGGWFVCQDSMTGTIFGIYSTNNYLDPVEIMLYSQEAIQINAISADATNPSANYPAANALQKIVVLLVTATTNTCLIAEIPATGLAKVEINLKAFGQIKGVALLSGYRTVSSYWPEMQTNVAISVNKVGNIKHQCGVLADYYSKYSEVTCNVFANQIIFEQLTAGKDLRFCGLAVLSDCECAQSSFDPMLITSAVNSPFASVTTLSLQPNDSIQTIKFNPLIPDTVSSTCGTADGFTKCGLRQIFFTDRSSGFVISSWPYYAFDWDPVTHTLKVNPASATTTKSVFTATLGLVSQPKVIYSQEITVNVAAASLIKTPQLLVKNQVLIAQINQESVLQLPDQGPNSSYALIGTRTFSVILKDTKLTVLSSNLADVGTHKLTMSLLKGNQTVNFQVNVVFTVNQANETADQGSTYPSSKTLSTQQASEDNQPAIRSLKKMSNRGLLIIEFSKEVEPIFNLTDFMIHAEIIVKYGSHYSYNNSFAIHNMTDSKIMNIQVNFTAPLNVSAGKVPDKIFVQFNQTMRTLSNSLPVVYLNDSIEMPMQHSENYYEQILINTVSATVKVLNVASGLAFAISFFVNFSLSQILGNVSALTVICTLHCANFKFPALSLEIASILLEFVQFDYFDCEPLYDKLFGVDDTEPYTSNFEFSGYSSRQLARNMGSVFVISFFFLVLILLLKILLFARFLPDTVRSKISSFLNKFFWNGVFSYVKQNYIMLVMGSLLNITNTALPLPAARNLSEQSLTISGQQFIDFNAVFNIFVLSACITAPIALIILSHRYFERLKKQDFQVILEMGRTYERIANSKNSYCRDRCC